MVLSGQAGDHLLDSYHDERQPVGKQVVDRAMKSVADMLPISTALGFRPDKNMDEGWAGLHELAEASAAGAPVVSSCRAPSSCRTTSSTLTASNSARATAPTRLSRTGATPRPRPAIRNSLHAEHASGRPAAPRVAAGRHRHGIHLGHLLGRGPDAHRGSRWRAVDPCRREDRWSPSSAGLHAM